MRAKHWAAVWCVVVCIAAVASSKKPATPVANQPGAAGDAALTAAVSEAAALTITPAQLETKCLAALKGQPAAPARCTKANDDMTQCVASYPGASDGAARQQCFDLRSSS